MNPSPLDLQLLIEPSEKAAADYAALSAAASASGAAPPLPAPPPPLDIWAGLQLVAESLPGNGNEEVMLNGKQIGAGGLARSLQPLQHVLKTLCLQVRKGTSGIYRICERHASYCLQMRTVFETDSCCAVLRSSGLFVHALPFSSKGRVADFIPSTHRPCH